VYLGTHCNIGSKTACCPLVSDVEPLRASTRKMSWSVVVRSLYSGVKIYRHEPKSGGLLCPHLGGAGSPCATMWPGPRPSTPSGILIHPTIWPQYTNVTDRQWSDRIGRTVLQSACVNKAADFIAPRMKNLASKMQLMYLVD